MSLEVLPGVLLRHRPQALHGLVPDDGLLHCGEALQGRQEAVDVLLPAHQRSEGAQLLRQRQQHLVLVIDGVGEEGDQLGPRPLNPQRQGDGGELLDGVQPQLHVLIPELVNQDCDGIERIISSVCSHDRTVVSPEFLF